MLQNIIKRIEDTEPTPEKLYATVLIFLSFILPLSFQTDSFDVFLTIKFLFLFSGVFLLITIGFFFKPHPWKHKIKNYVYLAPLLLLMCFSVLDAINKRFALLDILKWVSFFVVFLSAGTVISFRLKKKVLTAIFLSSVITAIYALVQKTGHDPLPWPEKMFISTLGNPNYLGQFLIIIIPAGISLILVAGKRKIRYIIATGCLIVGIAIFFTGSLGAFFGVLAGMITWISVLLLHHQQTRKVFFIVILTFIIGAGVFHKLKLDDFRKVCWQDTLQLIIDNPLSGIGTGNFMPGYPKSQSFAKDAASYERIVKHAHNDFFEWMTELGIPGAGLWLAFICYIFFRVLQCVFAETRFENRVISIGMIAGMASLSINALASFGLRNPVSGFCFWLFGGLLFENNFSSLPLFTLKRFNIIITIICLTMGFLWIINYLSSDINKTLGKRALMRRQYFPAVHFLSRSVKQSPQSPVSNFLLAVAAGENGNKEPAKQYFAAASIIDPYNFRVSAQQAKLFYTDNQTDSAWYYLSRSMRINPYNPFTQLLAGRVFIRRKELKRALFYLKSASGFKKTEAEALNEMGRIFTYQGYFNETIRVLTRLVKLKPGDYNAYYNLGMAYEKSGNIKNALVYLKKSLALNPGDGSLRRKISKISGETDD